MESAGSGRRAARASWGLANVREERFDFGRGWSLERFSAHLLESRVPPVTGLPKS